MLKRVISASVMFPVVLLLLWSGSIYRNLFILCITAILLGEWNYVCYQAARPSTQKWIWATAGSAYIVLGCSGFWFVGKGTNWLWQLYLICTVAASDTGAYFVGKFFQGPKLAPSISPNKTWSGSVGGIVCTILVGLPLFLFNLLPLKITSGPFADVFFCIVRGIFWEAPWWFLIQIIFLQISLSITAQIGDLMESWVKRRLDVKDTSQLIPGHGGLLDRVDGLLLVSIIAGGLLGTGYFLHLLYSHT
ncbi:MAG: phosphatidate cytidylyltransferase [Pseudomonadota bacterium]